VRVLVLGSDLLVQRLTSVLAVEGIDVVHCTELPFAMDLIREKQFSLVIVDSLIENVANICGSIYDLASTPVVLMLKENEADWKTVTRLKVDGFLLKEYSDSELRIRVKVACQRPVDPSHSRILYQQEPIDKAKR
jgi:DNA-binding response OmpR family regulator